MILEEKVSEYIGINTLNYMDMLELMRRGSAEILYAEDDGVLMRDGIGGAYIISAQNQSAAESMLRLCEGAEVLAAHDQIILPLAESMLRLKLDMSCYQSAWTRPEPPEQKNSSPLPIRGVGPEYLERVDSMYPHGDREYITGRIQAGDIFGAFDGERLAAFIGTHVEGAMGMLEVDPAYRRQGLGASLFLYMTRRQLQLGRHAYSNIETHNSASLAMHEKYGFGIAEGMVYWLT